MNLMQLFHTTMTILQIKALFKEGRTVSVLGNSRSTAAPGGGTSRSRNYFDKGPKQALWPDMTKYQ